MKSRHPLCRNTCQREWSPRRFFLALRRSGHPASSQALLRSNSPTLLLTGNHSGLGKAHCAMSCPMWDIEDIQGKKFHGFARCIYCGADGGDGGLRDEYIIPKALGGKAVIEAASCKSCEAITSYIDGYLGRNIFYEYR